MVIGPIVELVTVCFQYFQTNAVSGNKKCMKNVRTTNKNLILLLSPTKCRFRFHHISRAHALYDVFDIITTKCLLQAANKPFTAGGMVSMNRKSIDCIADCCVRVRN